MHTHPETNEGSIFKGLLWVLGGIGIVAGFYLLLPIAAKKIPWRMERRLFENVTLYDDATLCKPNSETDAIVQKLLHRLYPVYPDDKNFSVQLKFVKQKEVNAFAFLAGRIFVLDGLLKKAQSPEELAAVLAHEIEHTKRRHVTQGLIQKVVVFAVMRLTFNAGSMERISELLYQAANLKFTRVQEEAADLGGLERLRDAHINAQGFKDFFSRGVSDVPEILSDHPSDQSRVDKANQFLKFPSEPLLSDAEWNKIKNICPL